MARPMGAMHLHDEALARTQPLAELLHQRGRLAASEQKGRWSLADRFLDCVTGESGQRAIGPLDDRVVIENQDCGAGVLGGGSHSRQFGPALAANEKLKSSIAEDQNDQPGKNDIEANAGVHRLSGRLDGCRALTSLAYLSFSI